MQARIRIVYPMGAVTVNGLFLSDGRLNNKHYVYLLFTHDPEVGETGYVKIGNAQDTAERTITLSTACPIPWVRLTMLLVKQKRISEAQAAYAAWRAVIDPVGLRKSDQEAVQKRMAKLPATNAT
jgi:hypothetical protein